MESFHTVQNAYKISSSIEMSSQTDSNWSNQPYALDSIILEIPATSGRLNTNKVLTQFNKAIKGREWHNSANLPLSKPYRPSECRF